MSSFLKKGKRQAEAREKKSVGKRIKAIYSIMGEIKSLAKEMFEHEEDWNEDNIVELAANYTDRPIENMEKLMLLGNLQILKDEQESGRVRETPEGTDKDI